MNPNPKSQESAPVNNENKFTRVIPNPTRSKASCLWHEVTEKEKEEIRKESKNLLNEFASKLSKIKTTTSTKKQEGDTSGTREEGEGWNTDPEFRDLTLLNAPFVEDDSIVAEKGGWKK